MQGLGGSTPRRISELPTNISRRQAEVSGDTIRGRPLTHVAAVTIVCIHRGLGANTHSDAHANSASARKVGFGLRSRSKRLPTTYLAELLSLTCIEIGSRMCIGASDTRCREQTTSDVLKHKTRHEAARMAVKSSYSPNALETATAARGRWSHRWPCCEGTLERFGKHIKHHSPCPCTTTIRCSGS